MIRLILAVLFTLNFTVQNVKADSQVVYNCANTSGIYGDSQVVYNLGNFGVSEEIYCQLRDLIIDTLVNQCGDALNFGKEVVLKNFKVSSKIAKKGLGVKEFQMDLEIKLERPVVEGSSNLVRKSLSLEKIKIKFESEDSIKPTLDNLKVVDISSSGVCK
ncbi:hypothetical protein M899_2011 [Bacteriovorax sp. BSW11_IV]|uniref:hypothetical protein n=1 Tax=Bacteriovorax sp. BSW11_IV TaxID=1353529 RepID=UPI000389E895|nr:hypothetical protein [Bacteriovorax sp. BSW11_IV]EQC46436.1 hypothetical protein M899_2011 [Bacteriovorax sp. BSW11_IV]